MASDAFAKELVAEFQEAFCFLDRDGDGCITLSELGTAIKVLIHNPTRMELESMMREINVNRDGIIEFTEFVSFMQRKMKEAEAEEELREAFKFIDKDQDDHISPTELKRVMIDLGEKVTDEEISWMIREADLDGDGRINYDEFVRMIFA